MNRIIISPETEHEVSLTQSDDYNARFHLTAEKQIIIKGNRIYKNFMHPIKIKNMYMNRYRISSWVMLLMFFIMSCDDLLEVENHSTIPVANFPANVEEAEAILIGSYDQVRDYVNNGSNLKFYEDRGDAFEVGIVGGPTDEYNQNLFSGNGESWTTYYGTIQNINILLAEVPKFAESDTRAQNVLAQAYFLRAYTYFTLARIWGDVPIVTEPVTSPDREYVGRSPAAEVFELINADIENAINNFSSDKVTDIYKASKPAAYALLAEVKMWSGKVLGGGENDFADAIEAIDFVEKSGVSLVQEFGSIFDNKKNPEIIFSIFFDLNEQAGMYARLVSAKEADIGNINLSLNPDLPISFGNTSRHVYSVSAQIRGLFKYPNDQRQNRSFLPILQQDGPDAGSEPDVRSYHQTKFPGTVFNNERQYDNDIIVYRLADMLLLKAEAYAALNELDNAKIYLDLVRNRAGIGSYTGPLDKTSLEMEILDERGRELFLELKRWHDLVRYHRAGTINIYSYVPMLNGKDIPVYWPVSENIIVLNDKIVQTDGY